MSVDSGITLDGSVGGGGGADRASGPEPVNFATADAATVFGLMMGILKYIRSVGVKIKIFFSNDPSRFIFDKTFCLIAFS